MTEYIKYESKEDMLKIDSSKIDLDKFIISPLHYDFQREIDIRIQMLTSMLDDPKMKYTGRDYDLFRGGKRAFLEVKNLFPDIREGMEELTTTEEE